MQTNQIAILCVLLVFVSKDEGGQKRHSIITDDPEGSFASEALALEEKRAKDRMFHIYWTSAVTGLICLSVYLSFYQLLHSRKRFKKLSHDSLKKRKGIRMHQEERETKPRPAIRRTMSTYSTLSKRLSFGSFSGRKRTSTFSDKFTFHSSKRIRSAVQKTQQVSSDRKMQMRQVISISDSKM
uniref:Uncharacterized protein n=1 Tax=Trichuris muris TaxID=70415 RepID=A0A5S6QFX4_TRIMR